MGNSYDAIAMPPDLERRVRELAHLRGQEPAKLILDAIEEYVAALEDVRTADDRLTDLNHGTSTTVPLADLLARYGVEG